MTSVRTRGREPGATSVAADASAALSGLAFRVTPERYHARLVASLYKHDPPLLRAQGDQRLITNAGHRWLAEHPVP